MGLFSSSYVHQGNDLFSVQSMSEANNVLL